MSIIPFGTGWFPHVDLLRGWRSSKLDDIVRAPKDESEWNPAVKDLKKLIDETPELYMGFNLMFAETWQEKDATETKTQVTTVDELLRLFDTFIYEAPDFGVQVQWGGLITLPFNAAIYWPITTQAGAALFTHPAVNAQLKKIFDAWAKYLHSKPSVKVLHKGPGGWLSEQARDLLKVPAYNNPNKSISFYDAFKHGPGVQTDDQAATDPYYGFTCWDAFFTREFKDGIRPLDESDKDPNVIVAACESDVTRIYRNVKPMDTFWVKAQPYSLLHILNHDRHYSEHFIKDYDPTTGTGGATVFQAFLSPKNYHRWNAPVGGRILKTVIVPGTYFAVSHAAMLDAAVHRSQAYITQTATRALIFIGADGDIGLMCFVAVGMAEVSTCEVTVAAGDTVEKGDQLGMFHHGGSTHCLIFPYKTAQHLTFNTEDYPNPPPDEWEPKKETHVCLKRKIATYNA